MADMELLAAEPVALQAAQDVLADENEQVNPAITNKLSNALMVHSAAHFERNFTQKAQKEQFGVSKDQKVPKGYAIHFNDGKNTYSKNNDWNATRTRPPPRGTWTGERKPIPICSRRFHRLFRKSMKTVLRSMACFSLDIPWRAGNQ